MLEIIKNKGPRTFFLQFHNLDAALADLSTSTAGVRVKMGSITLRIPDDIEQWLGEVFEDPSALNKESGFFGVVQGLLR